MELGMAEELRDPPDEDEAGQAKRGPEPQYCRVCGVKISTYNPGPNCWQHTIGYPWRGPTAKPKF
jgi:hypothetical protein